MLYLERIDVLPLTGFLAEASACKQGYDGSLLQPVVFVEALANPLWAVFSQGTDPALVEAFRQEMSALKDSGFLDARTRQHQVNWQTFGLRCVDSGQVKLAGTDRTRSTPSSPEIAAMTDQPITSLDVSRFLVERRAGEMVRKGRQVRQVVPGQVPGRYRGCG